MTIEAKCLVCRNPDRRRAVELMWNGGMSAPAISRVLADDNLPHPAVLRHLKQHADGDGNARAIVVEPERPARERVLALQRLQLDEVERRIELAKAWADEMNRNRQLIRDAQVLAGMPPDDLPDVDWSDRFDVLGKDGQSAINSILKAQSLSDRRDKATGELKLGLFEAMANAGLAPKALSGGKATIVEPDDD